MPKKLLMGDIVLRAQRRSDMEKSSPLSIPEWKSLVSEQYGELYSIVAKSSWRYFESASTITATGAASYPVPSDHDMHIGVDRVVDTTGRTEALGEVGVHERNAFSGQTGDARVFAVIGQNIVLGPRPLNGTYIFTYVPQAPDISSISDTTEVDVVTADGEAFLIWGIAAKALPKTESSTVSAVEEREQARARLEQDCVLRSIANPRRRVVVHHPLDALGYGYDDPFANDPASWRFR